MGIAIIVSSLALTTELGPKAKFVLPQPKALQRDNAATTSRIRIPVQATTTKCGATVNMATQMVRLNWRQRNWCIKSFYTPDYVGLLILVAIYLIYETVVEPFHRMFFIADLRISFPYAENERVTVFMNFAYSLFLPVLVMAVYNVSTAAGRHKHHVSFLGLAISLALASVLTDIIKNMVGRPRPDLLSRCKPSSDALHRVLLSYEVCTETNYQKLHDGWRSFPSGHSSFAFAGLGYVALFLAGQHKIFVVRRNDPSVDNQEVVGDGSRRNIYARGGLLNTLFCMLPLLGAAMIAISRCQDYRHDVYDVCTGAFLGWAITYWSYRRYWPRLDSPYCDEPYDAPSRKRPEHNFTPVTDEEERVGEV